MAELGAVHTSSLAAGDARGASVALLDEAFAGGFAVVQRQRRGDRALRAGYVEAVGVRADAAGEDSAGVMERIGRGSTYMLPLAAELDLSCDVACDWRDGAVW